MRIEKTSSTVFTPLDDGRAVLLNLDTLFYYRLNRTGAALWQQIEESKTIMLEDLVRGACERYDVDEEGARQSVSSFIERLEEYRMVHIA
ncbi:MAG TPA: PqqD family protein [Blastocatellia bacterium]|nr:PqqD family protein [Blastocatellia bacterium]